MSDKLEIISTKDGKVKETIYGIMVIRDEFSRISKMIRKGYRVRLNDQSVSRSKLRELL